MVEYNRQEPVMQSGREQWEFSRSELMALIRTALALPEHAQDGEFWLFLPSPGGPLIVSRAYGQIFGREVEPVRWPKSQDQ